MKFFRKLQTLFRKEKLDAEMAEEMRLHVELQTERNITAGMKPEDARYAALRQFGNVSSIQEQAREGRGWVWLEQFLQDLRHAWRGLRKSQGFTLVAMLTIALGIGATTALFSVIKTVLFQPLPYHESERLLRVWDTNVQRGLTDFPASVENFLSWQEESRQLAGLAAWRYGSATLATADMPERVEVVRVTGNLLSLLGVAPSLGRDFQAVEDHPGRDRVILISERFWERHFQRSPAALGRTLLLDGETHEIIGIAPAPLPALAAADVWKPMAAHRGWEARSMHWLRVVGRLKPGVPLATAQQEMDAIAGRLAVAFPDSNRNWGVRLEPFTDWIVPAGTRKALWVLFGAVTCVLLIAAANLTNLLLVRAAARTREMAVRAALGAGRARLVRQTMTEAAVLVAAGAAAGWLSALWAVHLLRLLRPGSLPRIDELGLDGGSLAFTLGLALGTALVAGTLPAWLAARVDLQGAIKQGTGTGVAPRRRFLQGGLAVAQLTLSFVLLVGALLLGRSFLQLQNAPAGFEPAGVHLFRVSPPAARYPAAADQARFFQELTGRITLVPGVSRTAVTSAVPFDAATYRMTTRVRGRNSALVAGEMLSVERFNVGPDYFSAIGTTLRSGRAFSERDAVGAPLVAILNESAARRLWPGQDPVGKVVLWNGPLMVVGVVSDVRNITLDQPARPALYVSAAQHTLSTMTFVVQVTTDAPGLPAALRRELRAVDPGLPLFDFRPVEQLRSDAVAQPRFNTGVLAGFAGAALALAAIGLYGVTAYAVEGRTREFGVRMALGASPQEVLWLVLGRGARQALLGLALGLLLARGFARVIQGLLHETSATDPAIYTATSLLLLLVALFACWLPARRAAKVDPMVALRAE